MSESKILLSVIVPVYNAEKYLERSLTSLVNQGINYSEYEIICVDDGSVDGSKKIIESNQEKYSCIKYVKKENGGVSSARNKGLDLAEGEYVCFVDADDYVEKNYLLELLSNRENVDCVACGLKYVTEANKKEYEIICHEDQVWENREDFVKDYCKDGALRNIFFGPCCKLYSRDLIGDLRFNEGLLSGEDIVFNLNYLTRVKSIKVINKITYIALKHDNSATNSSALGYSPRAEHGYTYIRDCIRQARKELGIDEEWLSNVEKKKAPLLLVTEIINLYSKGSPYNKKQALEKVRLIFSDKEFMNNIKSNSFFNSLKSEKVAILCARLKSPRFAAFLCKKLFRRYYRK